MGSHELFERSGEPSRMFSGPYMATDQKTFRGYTPVKCLDWSQPLADELLAFFVECDYPFRLIEDIPFPDMIRSQIRRFFISLDAYKESKNPVIPIRDILYGAVSKDYAKTLKRIKRKSYQTTWKAELFEVPDWWDKVPSYKINDIGDIFNYSYLIFWRTDVEDYKHGEIPVSIDKEYLKKFKDSLELLLPDSEIDKIDRTEILKVISPSSTYDSRLKVSKRHYLEKPNHLSFARHIGETKRSVIPVSPENVRDSVILTPEALNTVSLIDQQLMNVLAKMPGHIHLRNNSEIKRRIDKLYDETKIFVQRDIRKEGITKPRQLLKAMLEVLHKKYPELEAFSYTDFYDDFSIRIGEETFIPKRGHGLGMANSLTTLMQLAVHQLITDEIRDDIPEFLGEELILNDDFVVGFNDEYHQESYWDKEDEVLSGLSIIRAPEKSFLTMRNFVIAERYVTYYGEWKKDSYQRRELLYPLTCYNIVQAKQYFISAQKYTDSVYRDKYIGEIAEYWGYEFFPTEFSYPYAVGGWVLDKSYGIDLSLKSIEELPYKSYVRRGFNACSYKHFIRDSGLIYESPIMKIYGFPEIPEEFNENYDNLPTSKIDWKYGRRLSSSDAEFSAFWDRMKDGRKKKFNSPFECTFEDLVGMIIESSPSVQYYPCDFMIKRHHRSDIYRKNIKELYIDPNPHLACVSKYNETSYMFKEDFSIRFASRDTFEVKNTGSSSKAVERSLRGEKLNDLFIGSFHEFLWPRDSYEPQEQYINAIGIGAVASNFDWGKGYPELKDQFKHPLVNNKKEIYGRFLNIDELIWLSDNDIPRRIIKIVMRDNLIPHLLAMIDDFVIPEPALSEFSEEEEFESAARPSADDELTLNDLMEKDMPKFWIKKQGTPLKMDLSTTIEYNKLITLIHQLTWDGAMGDVSPDDVRESWIIEYEQSAPYRTILSRNAGLRTFLVPDSFENDENDAIGINFDSDY